VEITQFGTLAAVKQALKIVKSLYADSKNKINTLRTALNLAFAEKRRSQLKISKIRTKRL
jgi:hypothetical protein